MTYRQGEIVRLMESMLEARDRLQACRAAHEMEADYGCYSAHVRYEDASDRFFEAIDAYIDARLAQSVAKILTDEESR